MKKVLLTAALVLVAANAFAGIATSKHDLSTTGGSSTKGNGSDQVCKYCHVPHNANTTEVLWSRSGGSNTFAGSNKYASATLNATTAFPTKAQSTACLSCHSTTTGTGPTADTAVSGLSASAVINDNANGLTNDHPVGFAYNATLVANDGGTGLVTPTSASAVAGLPLYAESMECATCHAVHDGTTNPSFLRAPIAGSQLCLKCHIK